MNLKENAGNSPEKMYNIKIKISHTYDRIIIGNLVNEIIESVTNK